MLHAVIRTDSDAFHFFGEVNGYNLQTLRQHVHQTVRESGPIRLQLKIDPKDQLSFHTAMRNWLSQLQDSGTVIEVSVRTQQRSPTLTAAH